MQITDAVKRIVNKYEKALGTDYTTQIELMAAIQIRRPKFDKLVKAYKPRTFKNRRDLGTSL